MPERTVPSSAMVTLIVRDKPVLVGKHHISICDGTQIWTGYSEPAAMRALAEMLIQAAAERELGEVEIALAMPDAARHRAGDGL
jgi:hypothetical protein